VATISNEYLLNVWQLFVPDLRETEAVMPDFRAIWDYRYTPTPDGRVKWST